MSIPTDRDLLVNAAGNLLNAANGFEALNSTLARRLAAAVINDKSFGVDYISRLMIAEQVAPLASQPKAPAPVPVAQGEAVIRFNGDRASASAIATWANAFPEIDEGEPNCSYITTDGSDAVDDLLLAMGDENRPVRVGDYVTRLDSEFIILRFCPMGLDEADELLTALNLDPNTYRTDGGWLNLPKIKAAITNPADYPRTPANMAVGAGGDAVDWGLDISTGTPILVHKNCSVIESEQARYVLRLIAADQATPAPEQATTGSGQGVTDAERLDALEDSNAGRSMWIVARGKDSFTVALKSPHGNCVTRKTLRAAIDAAILSTASPAGEVKV